MEQAQVKMLMRNEQAVIPWDAIVDGVQWIAKDEDDIVWGFRIKPQIMGCEWHVTDDEGDMISFEQTSLKVVKIEWPEGMDWKQSLRRRPKKLTVSEGIVLDVLWDDIPIWIQWIAKDGDDDGTVNGYRNKPNAISGAHRGYWIMDWDVHKSNEELGIRSCQCLRRLDKHFRDIAWDKSLTERPS